MAGEGGEVIDLVLRVVVMEPQVQPEVALVTLPPSQELVLETLVTVTVILPLDWREGGSGGSTGPTGLGR